MQHERDCDCMDCRQWRAEPGPIEVARRKKEQAKTCVGCTFALWDITKNNRLHPSGEGKCLYIYKIPPLPVSMCWREGVPLPNREPINRKKKRDISCGYFRKEM